MFLDPKSNRFVSEKKDQGQKNFEIKIITPFLAKNIKVTKTDNGISIKLQGEAQSNNSYFNEIYPKYDAWMQNNVIDKYTNKNAVKLVIIST